MEPEDTASDISGDETVTSRLTESHRHRVQNAMFTALWVMYLSFRVYLYWHPGRLEEHVVKGQSNGDNGAHIKLSDEELSTARLLANTEPGGGVLDPREYQIELFERARASNTIAVLDTGSGKTLVAVLLLKHILQIELNKRANGRKPRVAFFLVDSVTLVFQQSAVLRNNLDQKIGQFYGNLGPDLWDQQTWKNQLEKYLVIVCTAEILNHSLLNGHIRIDQINLLIFDEAHHTKKEHPYARYVNHCSLKTLRQKLIYIY